MTLAAAIRTAAARATLTLPFRVPLKEQFTIREVAALSGMRETFVEEAFDAGRQLAGYLYNGAHGRRMSKRIPRAWVVAFLIRSATYTDDSLAEAYLACLPHLPPETLLTVADTARRLAAEASLFPAGAPAASVLTHSGQRG